MATGRDRKSSSRYQRIRRRRRANRQFDNGRKLQMEPLEERQLLAVGPQIVGVQTNDGDLLKDGEIYNVSPKELTFQFNEGQVIDAATLDAIRVTRSGLDGVFDHAAARTDFNTSGGVVVEFQAAQAGPAGADVSLSFSRVSLGSGQGPRVTVDGKSIQIDLNTSPGSQTTAIQLVNSLAAHPDASQLVQGLVISGPTSTIISATTVNYSPVDLAAATAAAVSTDFGTGSGLSVVFTATQSGFASQGQEIQVSKRDFGGAAEPIVELLADGSISIELNTSPGAQTTASQLVDAFNRVPEVTAIATARLAVGDPATDIASPATTDSPLILQGVRDVEVVPGYVGLGDSDREVIFRFAEPLPDDHYRIDVIGAGQSPLRNDLGIPLGDDVDDQIDNGQDFSVHFELDLGAQILGVIPQPVYRSNTGTLSQSMSQIEVYFNDDDLDPRSVTVPDYYQLIYTNDTVEASDDVIYKPIAVQYFKESDRAMLTFAAPLHQLGSGPGTFRLRIGTDEQVADRDDQLVPVVTDLTGQEVGSSYTSAHVLGDLSASQIISSSIDPQVFELAFPGASDEPGHRDIRPEVEEHLHSMADPVNGVSTLYYNFRSDYGVDPQGTSLTNLITEQQKQRAREVFEIYGQKLGIQFVETESQGFTIATGDLRTIVPDSPTGSGDGVLSVFEASPQDNDLRLVLDNAENWYDGLGRPDNVGQQSWFEAALQGVGGLLGVGDTYDLPPGTYSGSDPQLGFGAAAEPVYPGDHDIVHGRHLYRAEGKDIDLYQFTITESGLLSAETFAERSEDSSLLDTSLALFRESGGQRELIARNDDYYSNDSFLEFAVEPGVYYIGVSAAGNESYDPVVEDSGVGGLSEGDYDLRLTFRKDADNSILDADNVGNTDSSTLSQGTPIDGDGDGVPGGVFNFWFRVDATPIFVDKAAIPGGSGTINSPYREIDVALSNARPGDVVRIVGNGGVDENLATPEDSFAYEIGFGLTNQTLEDGNSLEVPRDVTVMVDRGAVLKLRRARIGVGSSSSVIDRSGGAFQVLGTPRMTDLGGRVVLDEFGQEVPGSVFFVSHNDETLGGDSNLSVPTEPAAGDWGGIVFRGDLDEAAGRFDYEQEGVFLNYINEADIRHGGGTVVVNGIPVAFAPVHAIDTRPTITNNSITLSAQAAMSANPDAFEETNFHAPQYQSAPFTSDYTRVGPEIHGNRLVDNSINGLFVRTTTPAGQSLEKMTVSGRWDDSDVVHVVAENLRIQGAPGGPVQTLNAPDVALVRLTGQAGGALEDGIYDYRLTFVDVDGNESPASDATTSIEIATDPADANASRSVLLENLPTTPSEYVGRRVYRSVKGEYVLIAELVSGERTFIDQGAPGTGLLQGSSWQLNARLHGQLVISPGTIVKLNGAGIETSFGSQLLAEGVEGREVVFTSLLDNRFGAGGTFQTSEQAGLEAGNWTGIYAGHMSKVSIDHAVLAYGGGVAEVPGTFAGFNVLEIHQAEARLTNSVLEMNANGFGGQALPNREGRMPNGEGVIFVRGAQPLIVNNVMRDNGGAVISIDVNSLNSDLVTDLGRSTGTVDAFDELLDNQGPLVRWNRLANNDLNGMQVRGGTLTTAGVWDDTDMTHVVMDETIYVTDFHTSGGLRLESSGGESLVVKLQGPNAGFTATGRPLDITDRIGGMLHIVGQPGFPVVLTSIQDDRVAAGFQPDGTPQTDTNNDGNPYQTTGDPTGPVILPTVPDVPNGLRIDNNVVRDVVGHFEFEPLAGGGSSVLGWTPPAVLDPIYGPWGPDGVTAQGTTQSFLNDSFVFDFNNFVDVGSDGQAVDLSATTVATPPALTNPDEVTSAGNFAGANGAIDWQARSYFVDGVPTLFNEITFSSATPFGDVQFINYLDEDVGFTTDDLMYVSGTPGDPNFEVFTLDNAERIGFSQGGIYTPGVGLSNATWDGWAADAFPDLTTAITTTGTTYSVPGNIDTLSLPPVVDPALGDVYGLADVTTAFAWTLDPTATTATITTFLNLIPQDPAGTVNFAGDWRSVEIQESAHDRNVALAVESESGQSMIAGVNETPDDAQYLGALAPHEKAGDDNQRLGFEVHGSLNRPGDLDVYSFDADAGTEIWLDIDRTTHALDTVVDLLDADGNIIARSDNSLDESRGIFGVSFDPTVLSEDQVNPLGSSTADVGDLWSTNPRDAGLRVVLPGPSGTTNTYHVRVRSAGADLNDVNGGQTSGVYQLQVRLRELDELPGTTIQYSDIRYATTGIDIQGGPLHSPLTGEAIDSEGTVAGATANNNTRAAADDLGNLLTTDRGTLAVSGELGELDELQRIEWATAPTQGQYTLALGGAVTPDINFDADAPTVQAALETVTGAGNVSVAGAVGGPFDVAFQGTLAGTDVAALVPAAGTTVMTTLPTVTTVQDGSSGADVDWYRFEVAYDAIHAADDAVPRHVSLAFDIDYADGFARPNTNLWVFDSQGQLVFVGRDSNVPEDRPGAFGASLDDLSRGSVGALDPFIGPVEVPATGFAPGEYFVAVSSNAMVPQELDQYLSGVANNSNIRLEPINTVNRIAEDHAGSNGYTTAESPQIPILFGAEDQIVLSPPPANHLADGESFTITDAAGVSRTYEFDANSQVRSGSIPVPYDFGFSSVELGEAIETAILASLPDLPDLTAPDAPIPTADAPLVYSQLIPVVGEDGSVTITEGVQTLTLLSEISTTDAVTGQVNVQSMVRPTYRTQAPEIRQTPADGAQRADVFISRPAAIPFNLGDVTLFVSHDIGVNDRSDLVAIDPFTGQLETIVGAYDADVGDIATTPTGGLFGFSIPQALAVDDANTGHYIQIDPSLTTSAALGTDLGDDGIVTSHNDPANVGTPLATDVGIQFEAVTFSNTTVDDTAVRGFAIGVRGDTTVDPLTGVTTSTALGISNPANTIFEFNAANGTAVDGTLGTPTATDQFAGAGASVRDRGALDTSTDAFPVGGGNTTITGVAATTIDSNSITQWFIEDGDVFQVDEDADGAADWTFEFDTGFEYYMDIDPTTAVPQILRDGDSFIIDGQVFEFDTGSVLLVNALNGNQLNDGGTITITNSATNPTTLVFEFDNDSQFTGNVSVPFTATDNRAAIMANLIGAINTAPNFGVQAVQLGNTNRITLIGESTNSPVVVAASGIAASGLPLAQTPGATAITVEETYTEDLIGQAIMGAIDGTQPGGFQAGAVGKRINFLGVTTSVDLTTGIQSPVFTTTNVDDGLPTGVPGTIGAQNLAIPFLASDSGVEIGARVEQAVVQRQIGASLTGATVLLDPNVPQPTFICNSLGTPPLIGQRGTPDCSLRTGGVAPGGLITGAAFIGDQLFAVTDQGALFRVANFTGGAFDPDSDTNVADYVDGSAELLAAANVVVTEQVDPQTGSTVTTTSTEPIRFVGLSAGPQNAEQGAYANMLFGIDVYGRMFAFDTYGRPQGVFAHGAAFVDTELGLNRDADLTNLLPTDGSLIQGFSFSNLDENLWHRTDVDNARNLDAGHGVQASLDGSRLAEDPAENTSYYFGYEGETVQPQLGEGVFAPTGALNTYNFPGGARGSMISNPFSLAGYAAADKPTLYFNYLLDTENIDADLVNTDLMRDAFRVYGAGEDGQWKLLATNNSDTEPGDLNDEFDPFDRRDPESGVIAPEQPVQRAEAFDNSGLWRQSRVDLSPLAGLENLRLRFEFSTDGGLSTGGISTTLDLNTAGNLLQAVGGDSIRDGQMFTLTDLAENPSTLLQEQILAVGFEFDMGPTIVAPTGTAIQDGDVFNVDGVNYEFDIDGNVGVTTSIPHTPVPFVGDESAAELAAKIAEVLIASPPPPESIAGNLAADEPNDTLTTAFDTTLDGTTQIFAANGQVGDNFGLNDRARDVDMVRLFLDAGDTIIAETDTTRLNTQLNTYLRLFDAQGNELAVNDDRDPNTFNKDSLITYTAPQRGEYFVGISGSHHRDYDPSVSDSGGSFTGVVTSGFYDFQIQVIDPVGPQLSGNRLNLPNNRIVTASGLPATFVEGAAGVASGLTHPYAQYDATLADLPVVPVRVHSGMDSLSVADAVRTALADHFAAGNVSAYKGANDSVQVVHYGIGDSGPLGLSGPSDTSTALAGSGLFGDRFGAFGASAGPDGVTSLPDQPGALGMQNNAFEGVYIDDIVIGFAGRGEMVVGSQVGAADLGFTANTDQPADEIVEGLYQLEIRQASVMGHSLSTPQTSLDRSFDLTEGIDVNDRLANTVTLAVSSGEVFTDGQTFDLSDGSATVTFELDDVTAGNGANQANVAIEFDPGDSAIEMARRIRDAINSPQVQALLDVQAVSGDGVSTGLSSTSTDLNLIGEAILSLGPAGSGVLDRLALEESNDTVGTAVETNLVPQGREGYRGRGFIGDNSSLSNLSSDVDLFRVELSAGDFITVDIDASELGSSLDSIVQVFDANGVAMTVTDALGVTLPIESDDDLAPGEAAVLNQRPGVNRDSYVAFLAPADGVYYIGVSGFGNDAYDPTQAGSGHSGVTGFYEIAIERPAEQLGLAVINHDGRGDSNLFRDQGQLLIASNVISDSQEWAIRATSSDSVAPRNLATVNVDRLAPSVSISNNLLTGNAVGGIEFSGDAAGTVVPFGRIFNNTIVGKEVAGASALGEPILQGSGTGISVSNNASPTLLNNVLSTLETGVQVDTSSTTTVVGGSLYHRNLTDTVGVGLGDFSISADPNVELFVDRANGNYYPAAGSAVIDSSVDSLEERESMVFLGEPIGIAPSPILAPDFDVTGQLRVDDTHVAPPPGMGENVFKDRGAQDRSDFQGPNARLISPLDNGGNDLDPSDSLVSLFRATLDEFSIQLVDRLEPVGGIGVDDSSINGSSIQIVQDNRLLEEGIDYSVTYNTTSNTIRLTPLAGVWDQESNYVIRLVGTDRFQVDVTSGDLMTDGMSFDITDSRGDLVTFEYDSGYVMQVPQTLAIQVPELGGAVGGVEDGDLITLTIGTFTTTIELDNDGAFDVNNIEVPFTVDTTQGELADALAVALDDAGVGLTPVNKGQGLVHLGVDGTQTMTVVSNTLLALGGTEALQDGDEFTIDDGTQLVTFEFDDNSRVSSGSVGVPFDQTMTHEEIAQKIAESINIASGQRNLGLFTQHVGDGAVHIGGMPQHVIDVLTSPLVLTGTPGAQRGWGIQIPTEAGAIAETLVDGQTFTIDNGAGGVVTFEFDDNSDWTGGNVRVPFTNTTTPQQLGNTLVSRISNYNHILGLFPQNAGFGYVVLGGDVGYSMDLVNSVLTEVGQAGVSASVAIPFIPDDTFTVEAAAQATADAINNAALRDVVATATGGTAEFSGAQDATSVDDLVFFTSGIKDLAGNELAANQTNGETRFTVFVGAGMDYGDAPNQYPTVRANDGARHEIVEGFSLGATVDVNADGQPTANADGDDLDGDDEDGVVFDSTTPLVPNRTFSLTVSTTGIGTVVGFGVLDGWIDYNGDGDWNDSGEKIISSRILTAADLVNGDLRLTNLTVPGGAVPGDTYARFRLSTESGLGPAGTATAGEVEDYLVTIHANPWQNQILRFDVNGDGAASPIDVLLQINYLNDNGSGALPLPKPVDRPFLDVNGDGNISPLDVLQLVNYINDLNNAVTPEGESSGHLEDVLRQDEPWLEMVGAVNQASETADARDAIFSEFGA